MAKIEILAPAGGYDSVVAAVRSGADAVYLGEKRFSARASAKNFSDEELRHAVAYCHVHGVKVYVTLNTLVFDEEFEALAAAIRAAAEADADALIVQNMGVARLARQIAPELPLHASTQMSVHTASGVQALCEMGFKRVVLAREMSREEIKKAAKLPIELEVFVHGALCMSVSGQCYFSAMLGSRSGNRGVCAQTCRLPFSVNSQKGGYALSLKDNSLIPHLADMQAIGIASAKIEGRMKRPEYVAAAVRACVEQRDLGFITDQTAAQLRGVFSRTG
ncbi:MAG: U32 family peptidase, partial [Ruminococcus sp.]|nr:U32 family peptidase [Ruminococcus sp.]